MGSLNGRGILECFNEYYLCRWRKYAKCETSMVGYITAHITPVTVASFPPAHLRGITLLKRWMSCDTSAMFQYLLAVNVYWQPMTCMAREGMLCTRFYLYILVECTRRMKSNNRCNSTMSMQHRRSTLFRPAPSRISRSVGQKDNKCYAKEVKRGEGAYH